MLKKQIISFLLLLFTPCSLIASSDLSAKRHFIFPSEVVKLSNYDGKKYQVLGIVSGLTENNDFLYEFLISDQNLSVKVIFDGVIPDLLVDDIPIAVAATWDGNVLKADTIWAKFTGKYLSDAELSELQSYGLPVFP